MRVEIFLKGNIHFPGSIIVRLFPSSQQQDVIKSTMLQLKKTLIGIGISPGEPMTTLLEEFW